jgi:hypothetical protein
MGWLDRARAKQEQSNRRKAALGGFGDELINAAEHVGNAINVLRGTCGTCGQVVTVQAQTTVATTTCTNVTCQKVVTVQAS